MKLLAFALSLALIVTPNTSKALVSEVVANSNARWMAPMAHYMPNQDNYFVLLPIGPELHETKDPWQDMLSRPGILMDQIFCADIRSELDLIQDALNKTSTAERRIGLTLPSDLDEWSGVRWSRLRQLTDQLLALEILRHRYLVAGVSQWRGSNWMQHIPLLAKLSDQILNDIGKFFPELRQTFPQLSELDISERNPWLILRDHLRDSPARLNYWLDVAGSRYLRSSESEVITLKTKLREMDLEGMPCESLLVGK